MVVELREVESVGLDRKAPEENQWQVDDEQRLRCSPSGSAQGVSHLLKFGKAGVTSGQNIKLFAPPLEPVILTQFYSLLYHLRTARFTDLRSQHPSVQLAWLFMDAPKDTEATDF